MDNQVTQTKTDLQQPRNDLQPTSSGLQQGGEVSGSSNALSQEQLTDKQLRVGDSATTVQNTTTATPYKPQSTFPSAWIWFLLVLAGVVVAIFVLRHRVKSVESIETTPSDADEVGVPKPKTRSTPKKAKSTSKSRSTAKRKHQR